MPALTDVIFQEVASIVGNNREVAMNLIISVIFCYYKLVCLVKKIILFDKIEISKVSIFQKIF